MKELDNRVVKFDNTKNRASLEVDLIGNDEAISFINEVLGCLIDSCQKNWEKEEIV